ncbi:zinc ABC transporter substrate-binding protein ZnuA [secondary endosymbiont of Heteropsylla cubana]|nr:zinc ABC transporter substrate-binding protein ZnuA [secondary endosymbiont of Heteropsylla cubana]
MYAHAAILTSIRPLGFIAAAIADKVIPVEVMLPDHASPHTYTLRPTDGLRLKKADILIWVGPELESFLSGLTFSLPTKRCITLSKEKRIIPLLKKSRLNTYKYSLSDINQNYNFGHQHGKYDMHLWLSPIIAEHIAQIIYEHLLELIPTQKKLLDENLQIFKNLLIENNKKIANILSPVRNKGYYVLHDAYGYYEKYYGLMPLGYFSITPEIQPGVQTLHKIRKQLIKKKAICIFSEPQFNSASIKSVARGQDVYIGMLDPLGIDISLDKGSYMRFLLNLSKQYINCLEKTYEDDR